MDTIGLLEFPNWDWEGGGGGVDIDVDSPSVDIVETGKCRQQQIIAKIMNRKIIFADVVQFLIFPSCLLLFALSRSLSEHLNLRKIPRFTLILYLSL